MTALKQGHSDGFCGIYSLANFLVQKGELDTDQAFKVLIEIAERKRLLTAWKILDGYWDYELVEIFNFYAENWLSDYRAGLLGKLDNKTQGGIALVRKIIGAGGAAVIGRQNDSHWVLAIEEVGKKVRVLDPGVSPIDTKISQQRSTESGVAIIPADLFSEFFGSTNAQTH